mgnify:CR=1 FL=1
MAIKIKLGLVSLKINIIRLMRNTWNFHIIINILIQTFLGLSELERLLHDFSIKKEAFASFSFMLKI